MPRLGTPAGLLLLVGLLAVWTAVSSVLNGRGWSTAAEAAVILLVVTAGSFVAGRLLGDHQAVVGPALAALLTGWVLASGGLLDRSPVAPPLGYSNANAALVVAAAALLLIGVVQWPVERAAAGWTAAGLLVAWTVAVGSVAAATGGVLLIALTAVRTRLHPPAAAALAGILVTAGAVVSLLLGLLSPAFAVRLLSLRRLELWLAAIEVIGRHPVAGSGPGTFVDASGAADADSAAAHSLWLQTGAELGLVGLALVATICALLLADLGRAPGDAAVVGCGLLAAFGLQASVDYVAAFPALLAVVAFTAGLAGGGRGDGRALFRLGADSRARSTRHRLPSTGS